MGGELESFTMCAEQRSVSTVCFTYCNQGSKIKSKFSLPKSMKHTVRIRELRVLFAMTLQ